jgi:hypothetical protein
MKKAAVFCVLFCATYSVAQTNSAPAGVFSADQEESPAGAGNGIAMSMQKCASQTHVCQIVAPAVYSLTENGIWGLLDPLARQIQPFGPKATDPIGCVTDLRYGGPRWLCNGGGPDPGDPSLINGPMFSMNTNRLRTGPYAAAPPSLTLTDTVFAGGHDFYYDEAESEALRIQIESHTPTSSQPIRANQRKYSPGDNLGLVLNTVGVGIGLRQNEGHELVHGRAGEMPEVYDGSITSVSCAPSGD